MFIASSKGCGLSYQRIVETVVDGPSVVERTPVPYERPRPKGQQEADSQSDDEPRQFRRVRLRCLQQAEKQGYQDGAESETLSDSGLGTIRCICGTQNNLVLPEYTSDDARPARMWLIQCVGCKVWQHRSCVGTANGYDPPGSYYCEECREVKPIDSLVTGDAKECTNECKDDIVKDDSNTVHRGGRNALAFGGSSWSGGVGFWACCVCLNVNSRELCRNMCGICGHRRCSSCSHGLRSEVIDFYKES